MYFIIPLSNRILIHDLQEEIEKQFDVKEDIPGRHSYAKYNNWEKVQYKMPVLFLKLPLLFIVILFSFILISQN